MKYEPFKANEAVLSSYWSASLPCWVPGKVNDVADLVGGRKDCALRDRGLAVLLAHSPAHDVSQHYDP